MGLWEGTRNVRRMCEGLADNSWPRCYVNIDKSKEGEDAEDEVVVGRWVGRRERKMNV